MLSQIQHLKRRKSRAVFDQIRNGEKAFEVCADDADLSLDVGDVITFQETDEDGQVTGSQLSRKVIYKEAPADLQGLVSSELAEAGTTGVSVLGLAVPEYRLLKSIFGIAVTANFAIDIEDPDEGIWDFIEGPFYAPLLAAPDLYDTGYLEGLHFRKWPPGRYSVTLLVKVVEAEIGKPLKVDVIDLLVLTLIKDQTEDQRYGGYLFEELDPIAILDGQTISAAGYSVTPLTPSEVKELIKMYEEAEEAVTSSQGDDLFDIYDSERSLSEELDDGLPDMRR